MCEVASPTTARIDRSRKMRVYARVGVANPWIAEPILRTVEVHRLRNGLWEVVTVHDGDAPGRREPFHVLELDVGRWWVEGAEA